MLGEAAAKTSSGNDQELARKQVMAAAYKSQAHVLATFDLKLESFRRQFPYDFSKPPSAEVINYEAWGWPVKAELLCHAFSDFMQTRFPSRTVVSSPGK